MLKIKLKKHVYFRNKGCKPFSGKDLSSFEYIIFINNMKPEPLTLPDALKHLKSVFDILSRNNSKHINDLHDLIDNEYPNLLKDTLRCWLKSGFFLLAGEKKIND
ncbi:hypothetical protein NGRA_1663 [Nosema granulosis]|uniref:Uncharacterized protein n=1 Tax=Nosema granulosis TaxID=83296 RepID=A0A9P6KYW3_9MICR|nr:hypothetical protein NGRA_1663 [Nosema granulosis]